VIEAHALEDWLYLSRNPPAFIVAHRSTR